MPFNVLDVTGFPFATPFECGFECPFMVSVSPLLVIISSCLLRFCSGLSFDSVSSAEGELSRRLRRVALVCRSGLAEVWLGSTLSCWLGFGKRLELDMVVRITARNGLSEA